MLQKMPLSQSECHKANDAYISPAFITKHVVRHREVTLQKAGLCHMIQLITQTKTWSESEFHSYRGMISHYHIPGEFRVAPSQLL